MILIYSIINIWDADFILYFTDLKFYI